MDVTFWLYSLLVDSTWIVDPVSGVLLCASSTPNVGLSCAMRVCTVLDPHPRIHHALIPASPAGDNFITCSAGLRSALSVGGALDV